MPHPPPRTRRETLFMAAPLVFALMLMFAIGILVFLVWKGGTASGPLVRFSLQGTCAKQAQSFIDSRMAVVLGKSYSGSQLTGDKITIQTQLPDLPGIADSFPRLISRVGNLEIRDGTTVLAERSDMESAQIALDESGMPYVSIKFKSEIHKQIQAHVEKKPDGHLDIYLDGTFAVKRPNSAKVPDDEFKIISEVGDARAMMLTATNRSILLKHGPLPCELSIDRIDTLSDGN